MVFGIGEGKIELRLPKLQFKPGETISGTVFLKVNQPKKARRLFLEFFGEQNQPHKTFDPKYGYRTTMQTVRIYSFALDLDAEKEYIGEKEYPFQLTIPSNLFSPNVNPQTGMLGNIMSAAQFLGVLPSPPKWFLRAALDLPLGFDIANKMQINIV